mgnify:CR=1 FL=1
MQKRVFSTVLLWGSIIAALLLIGPIAGIWLLTILAILTQYELYKLLGKMGYQPLLRPGLICGALIVLGSHYIPVWTGYTYTGAGLDLFFVSAIICSFFLTQIAQEGNPFKQIFLPTLFGLIWVPLMMQSYVSLTSHFAAMNQDVEGLLCALWLIVVAKFTDVGGLLVGMALGKNKLSPTISPNKTWEGAIGGVVVSTLVGLAFLITAGDYFPHGFTLRLAIIIAVPVACVSILSDLIESLIKRQAGMKDSGNMIPGIGGAFDLADSLLLSAPVGLILFKYLVF